jgi:surfeit locus 1 family protein
MRRLPLVPTIVVAAAVATMIWLGLWQNRRAEWKERLLLDYARAETMPALDLDPLLDRRGPLPPLAFRRALVTCRAENVEAAPRAGRSAADAQGQVFLVPCRPGARGLAGRLMVNAGWAPRFDAVRRLTLNGIVAGRIGTAEATGPIVLTAATAPPPLRPSAPVTIESIPNNHRFYMFTWFFFAAAAVAIYVLALKGRNAPKLPPEP